LIGGISRSPYLLFGGLMATTIGFQGSNYVVPANGDEGWGSQVSNLLIALGQKLNRKEVNVVATAGGTLTAPTTTEDLVVSSTSPVTLSATTAITNGTDGQILRLRGTDDTNTVTILNNANTTLNGACILGAGHVIELKWDSVTFWTETQRNN